MPENKSERIGQARIAKIRIVSGLILFSYILPHFLNHALGLVSVEAMEISGDAYSKFWRFPPFSILLYGALLAHFICALLQVYHRGRLNMPAVDWFQLLLGLCIPFLMLAHVMGTRFLSQSYGIHDNYTYVLISTYVNSPYYAWLNTFGLLAAWIHGCIGLHMWVRMKNWYRARYGPYELVFATMVPTLSLAGFLSAGREIAPLTKDSDFMARYFEKLNFPGDGVFPILSSNIETIRAILIVLIVLVILARLVRLFLRSRHASIEVNYFGGPKIRQPVGASLLDMSRQAGIPHASICGGRGRCSTCRVRILSSAEELVPADGPEKTLLKRMNAGDDIRLACQIHPKKDLSVMRLLPADTTLASHKDIDPSASGREQCISVMFVDIRDFTRTSESRLPYDVVYLINQFSKTMGEQVEAHNGRIDKFLGDGFLALFGLNSTPQKGAMNALYAAKAMLEALSELNHDLEGELDQPLKIGIGLHTGPAIIGEMGYGSARGLTALGDTVNTASRLEAATKEQKCVLCVSEDTVLQAGFMPNENNKKRIAVRGKKDKISVYTLNNLDEISKAVTKK